MVYRVGMKGNLWTRYAVKIVSNPEPLRPALGRLNQLEENITDIYLTEQEDEKQTREAAERDGNSSSLTTREVKNYLKIIRNGHPNIVNLLAFAENKDAPGHSHILYFEDCNKGDLFQFVKQFREKNVHIPEFFVWRLFTSVLNAVTWLHKDDPKMQKDKRKNLPPVLIHGDINTENVMLYHDFSTPLGWPLIKLGDFDCALALWDDREEFELDIGKMVSNPPEHPIKSKKGDVWGAGATIHMVIHGGFAPLKYAGPPGGNAVGESINSRQMYAVPPHYTRDLETTLEYALKMDPTKRWSAGKLLTHAQKAVERLELTEEKHGLRVPNFFMTHAEEYLNAMSVASHSEWIRDDDDLTAWEMEEVNEVWPTDDPGLREGDVPDDMWPFLVQTEHNIWRGMHSLCSGEGQKDWLRKYNRQRAGKDLSDLYEGYIHDAHEFRLQLLQESNRYIITKELKEQERLLEQQAKTLKQQAKKIEQQAEKLKEQGGKCQPKAKKRRRA